MKYMGKVNGPLPGEEDLNVTKSKEVTILFLRRDGVEDRRQRTGD